VDLSVIEQRLKLILPAEYQGRDVEPASMGSAGLKFGEDGKVAWDEIWGSFCDLAMAGGPPHKGKLLEPGDTGGARYAEVVAEICRAVKLVTGLNASAGEAGWVRVECYDEAMAGWLLRAITMENVAVRASEWWLDLPAGAEYRLEKEIKNVVTVIAKTCHYWTDHMWPRQHREIGELFAVMEKESPLVRPGSDGWRGVECGDVRSAVWTMRALVACNVLARREGTVLLVPQGKAAARAVEGVRAVRRS
jgi:hypothetical protein